MAKFSQFLTELSAHDTAVFLFQDNLSKSPWIFTKHNMFGISSGYILSLLTELFPMT